MAIVPMIKPEAKAAPVDTRAAAELAASRIIAPNAGLLRYVVDSPLSAFAESIRAVKVSVDLIGAAKSNKVIGITSSLPNEGKSTIAASLAQLSADGGARVILVDCDLRKPSLSQKLVPNATPGLIDVINDPASLDKVIWSDPSTRLSFLPVGTRSRLIHTSEILASDAMKRLFVRLRESYEYVIVDLSPVAPVVDVRSATHLLDSYVFVIRMGKNQDPRRGARSQYCPRRLRQSLGGRSEQGRSQSAQSLRWPRRLLLQSPLRPLRLHGLMAIDGAARCSAICLGTPSSISETEFGREHLFRDAWWSLIGLDGAPKEEMRSSTCAIVCTYDALTVPQLRTNSPSSAYRNSPGHATYLSVAGTPHTLVLLGTSRVTSDIAPMTTPSPTVTPFCMTDCGPI